MSIATQILSLRRDQFSSVKRLIAALEWERASPEDILLRRYAVRTENSVQFENAELTTICETMALPMSNSLFVALLALIASGFRTRAALQAEILALRHQLAVLQPNAPRHLRLKRSDRVLWLLLSRFWSGWRACLKIVQPATVIAWHRRAFAWYWTRKSRRRPGRPDVSAEIRRLICRMSQANPLWGAPRIHGELLKLGIVVAQSTVAKYLRRRRKPPSQGRKSRSGPENKAVTDRTFMRFRGPKALNDRVESRDPVLKTKRLLTGLS